MSSEIIPILILRSWTDTIASTGASSCSLGGTTDPRYSILPLAVWEELKTYSNHLSPLPVDGQARPPKGEKSTKLEAYNDECNTHLRFNAIKMKTSSRSSIKRWSGDPVVAIDGV